MTAELPRFVVACVDGYRIGERMPGYADGGSKTVPRSCSILDRLVAFREVARYDSSAMRPPDDAQALAEYDAALLNEWWDGRGDEPPPRLYRDIRGKGGLTRWRHLQRARAAQRAGVST